MEKVIYVLRRPPTIDIDDYAQRLRNGLAERLKDLGVRGLQINVSDSAVSHASGIRQTHIQPPIDALLNVWVDSAIDELRQPFDDAIAAVSPQFWAYLVTESQPLRNVKHPGVIGERTDGFAQMAFLKRPEQLSHDRWLDIWQNSHTRVAIETQSSFEYVQNVVIRRLTSEGPAFDGIVEECFPFEALSDFKMIFAASGDEPKFKRNLQRMLDSVARFIDRGAVEVVPTSQYVVLRPLR